MDIYVSAITHKYGVRVSTHRSRKGAVAEIKDYVRNNHAVELGTPAPSRVTKGVISQYFALSSESYFIEKTTLVD